MNPINSHHPPPPEILNLVTKFQKIYRASKSSKRTPIAACKHYYSPSALVDLIFSIAVIAAWGYLLHPCVTLVVSKTLETIAPVMRKTGSLVYGLLGLVVLITTSWAMLRKQKCGQPGCRGLKQSVEFDIWTRAETQDRVRNSGSIKYGSKKGLLELPRDYLNELEAGLKKMAPANGHAFLVFRGECGCPIVRLAVPGSKKNDGKMKK